MGIGIEHPQVHVFAPHLFIYVGSTLSKKKISLSLAYTSETAFGV